MASIGIVNADVPQTEDSNKPEIRPRKFYFGVFFDGTGNNAIQKNDAINYREKKNSKENWDLEINPDLNKYGAHEMLEQKSKNNDYSNVAFLHFKYQSMSNAQFQQEKKECDIYSYNIYVEGAGKQEVDYDSTVQNTLNAKGSGFGEGATGVTALVSKAVFMVKNVLKGFNDLSNDEIHFDVFGFSRGAACARMFAFLVARNSGHSLQCEKDFGKYSAKTYYQDGFLHFMDNVKSKVTQVDFLGIYDTVSSIGIIYTNNVKDYGLHSPMLIQKVRNTFHICAMDEFRSHFGLTDIGSAVNSNGNAEFFIPGCHSDVGGGYVDGVDSFSLSFANISLTNCSTSMYVTNPQNATLGAKQDVREALKTLGWYDDSSNNLHLNNYLSGKISVYRYIKAGYNKIPLKMMITRAEVKTLRKLFDISFKDNPRFEIPSKLSAYGTDLVNKAKTLNGRKWFYPSNSYHSTFYRFLRQNFLHFTSTDAEIVKYVHGPSKKDNIICRYVYTGDGSSSKCGFMCDYNGNAESITVKGGSW